MKDKMTTILVVDGHELVLQGIKRIIGNIRDITCIDTAISGMEACKLISSHKYDIYMLDIELPDIDGFELADRIREKNKSAYIIINTMHEETWIINKLLHCGVDSIILKSSETDEVKNAVLNGIEGKPYYCDRFKESCERLRQISCNSESFDDTPTPRELEVLRAIASGYNTLQIAEKLNISKNTVETFRKHLILKFNATNSVDLVVKAIDKGFIPIGMNK